MAKNLGRVVGKSAYEIWLEEGNTGSEADFLQSLEGQQGEGLKEPIIIPESSADISTIKFDVFEGYQHGTVAAPTNETVFTLNLADAKRGVMFIIHSNAPTEPEITGSEFMGGEYMPNELNTIYGIFLGDGLVTHYYNTQQNGLNIVNLGNISGAVALDLSTGNTFIATLTDSITLSFTNVPTGGTGIVLEFTNPEQIIFPAGANATDGEIREADGTRYKYIVTVRGANDYDVDGLIDNIEAVV